MRKIENINSLTNEIINQSKKEAEAIVDRAKRAAEHDIRFAHEDAEAIRKEYRTKAKKLALQEERKVFTQAHQNARKMLWQKKQELVSKVFDEAEKELKEFRNSPDYRESLITLTKEGIEGIGRGKMKVFINPKDEKFFTDELIKELESSLPDVVLEIVHDNDISAGVTIVSQDGKVVYENSYSDRLERLKDELRGKVAEMLLEERG